MNVAILGSCLGKLLLAGCATTAPPTREKMDQKELIIQAVTRMTSAFHAGDVDGVMAAYEDQATIVFEPGHAVTDKTTQAQTFEQIFTMRPRFSYGGHEVHVAGDNAIHLAPWTMTATAPDGSPVERKGLSVVLLRRQVDGNWRIAIDDPHGDHLLRSPSTP